MLWTCLPDAPAVSPLGSLGVPTAVQIGDGLSQEELLDIKVSPDAALLLDAKAAVDTANHKRCTALP